MNIHIEMDQGVIKMGPHNIDPKFQVSRILSPYYEVPIFSLPDPFLYVYSSARYFKSHQNLKWPNGGNLLWQSRNLTQNFWCHVEGS